MEMTVKEYAHAERVTVRTVKHWIAKGAVQVRRTPGGGIRIHRDPSLVIVGMVKNGERGGNPAA